MTSSALDTKLRDDLERLKKVRWHAGHTLLPPPAEGTAAVSGQEAAARKELAIMAAPLLQPSSSPCLAPQIRNHRGLRHYWGLTVRGQHTKTTGRRGKTVGVAKKK